ncbi:MAG: sensor domain-containing diguanylate cyclase, partial [Treponema sp.]|nr:sensor domain-containing diguanylate cyclase [Treponema sp.]
LKDALQELGLASFAAFPIVDRGQSLGSLGVAFKDETALDEARSSLFETMARQLGSIVRAAMLHAELERANARLDILASTDALTHLPNRRTALRVLEREISRAKRLGSKISVIMCDIDHFKLFNDRHGHDCGDYVLVQTATLIADSLRSTDLASRWGGEEFLLILGNADPEGVVGLAERIRKRVQAAVMEYEGLRLSVTITLGVAISSPDLGGDAVIAKADEALYEGKRLGRNRVGVAVDRDLSSLEIGKGFRSPQGEEEPLDLLPGED